MTRLRNSDLLQPILRLSSLILLLVLGSPGAVALAGTCGGGTIQGLITSDLSLSGDVCVTGNVTLRARLTLAPGTRLSVCDDCQIQVTSAGTVGTLVAEGTEAEPIVFEADDPAFPWRRLLLSWPVAEDTILRHVEIRDAGSRGVVNEAALEITELGGHPAGLPVVDRITITDSGSQGLILEVAPDDPTPPSVTNLTITGSTFAAIRTATLGIGGLGGELVFSGNGIDRIQVEGGTILRDLRWRNLGVPFEVLGTISLRDFDGAGEPARMTIEAGTTLRLHPGADLNIGTLGMANSTLEIEGSEAEPVLFTRVDGASDPWGSLRFALEGDVAVDSRISHAVFEHGGHLFDGDPTTATIDHQGNGHLALRDVEVRQSANAAIHLRTGTLTATRGRIESNRLGLTSRSFAMVRGFTFTGNAEGAVENLDPMDSCVDAIGNYWGAPDGPDDPSGATDACFSSTTNAGAGDGVSDGVLYRPFLSSDADEIDDRSSLSPDPYWVVADGVDEAVVTITLRDAFGDPVAGKLVELDSTLGSVVQPTAPTDAFGTALARVSSTEEGVATLSARNVTDGTNLGALGGIVFWSGGGETGGLVEPGGTPYFAPQLEVDGAPFAVGFPATFRVPMLNGNPVTVDVEITYAVSNLGVGATFTEVGTVSRTLAPGEEWDAELVWFPPSDGHRCVRATGTVSGDSFPRNGRGSVDVGPWRVNIDVPGDPCDELDVDKLVPSSGGVGGVIKHLANAVQQAYLVRECLNQNLTFRRRSDRASRGGTRDYEVVVAPAVYTPPALAPGGDVDAAEAAAATAVGDAAAVMVALDEARVETSRRARDAGRAGDDGAAILQQNAYAGFQLDLADAFEVFAAELDGLLAVTEGEGDPDVVVTPGDLQDYRVELETNGYDQETIDFHLDFGRSMAEIDALLQLEIASLEASPQVTFTLYELMRGLRDAALDEALDLRRQFDPPQAPFATPRSATAESRGLGVAPVALGPLSTVLEVGHPLAESAIVDLVARPVGVPLGWTWSLSRTQVELGPGETTEVELTIEPSGGLSRGGRARIAVEGRVEGDLVGGSLVERRVPSSTIFLDGFETGDTGGWSSVGP